MSSLFLEGYVERITYANEENGYTIAKIKVRERHDLVTILGPLPGLTPGEHVRLSGEWTNHPKYGEQFKVATHEIIVPATVRGIEKYLGSGLIKGIGPVMAKRIVGQFLEKTLDVIENDINQLCKIEGIGPVRIEIISKAWSDQKEIRNVMVFLQEHGISATYATKIYKQYGTETIKVVKENPYRLAADIFGIGFITADKIASKLGISHDAPFRIEAGIIHALNEQASDGHVYYPYEELIGKCGEMLDVAPEAVQAVIPNLADGKKIVVEDIVDIGPDEARTATKAVYLNAFYVCETGIANRITMLASVSRQLPLANLEQVIKKGIQQVKITLEEKQKKAIEAAITEKVVIITGGPGTGKTTIVKSIIGIYEMLGREVLLAAPTGRAAKRLSETTQRQAKTIHRLLEFQPKAASFKRNEKNPLETDALIVDESSMIDTVLMHHLLKAVPALATLILVGDIDQLPAVGPGNVMREMISSDRITVVRLTKIFRQAQASWIILNAHRINQGEMPQSPPSSPDELQDFYFVEESEPENIVEKILELVKNRIPHRFGFDPVSDIQVLTPMHKGVIGAINLNNVLQKALNPSNVELTRYGRTIKLNDKVMQVKNNYDKEVFNGDIGKVVSIDLEEQVMAVEFDNKKIEYDFSETDELALAYASSIHKAQGSEYPAVILPITTQHYILLQRNLLYTAVTRAKKLVVLIGTKKAVAIAIKNKKTHKRYTMLAHRIKKMAL